MSQYPADKCVHEQINVCIYSYAAGTIWMLLLSLTAAAAGCASLALRTERV